MNRFRTGALLVAGWLAPLALHGSPTTIPDENPGRGQAIAWVQANCKDGPRGPLAISLAKVIDDMLMNDKIVQVTFPPELLKSGRPTRVWLIDEQFTSLEYSDQQAQQIGIKPGKADVTPFPQLEELSGVQLYEISDLRVDNADHVDGARPITGTVSCKALVKTAEREFGRILEAGRGEPAQFELRLSYVPPGSNTLISSYYHLSGRVPAHGTLHFTCLPFNVDDRLNKMELFDRFAATGEDTPVVPNMPAKKFSGPVMLFASLCVKVARPPKPERRNNSVIDMVCSNVITQSVNVEDTPAGSSP